MTKITPKQRRFVSEYLIDLHGTNAAIRAGYSPKTARFQAARMLAIVGVGTLIQESLKKREERTEITQDRVLREYAKIAFSDIDNYVRFDPDTGNVYFDWSRMNSERSGAVAEITQDEYMEGGGETARQVKKTKFKLHDKKGALDSLAKHLGMFTDKSEVRFPDGITVNILNDEQQDIANRIARRRASLVMSSTNGHHNGNGKH